METSKDMTVIDHEHVINYNQQYLSQLLIFSRDARLWMKMILSD